MMLNQYILYHGRTYAVRALVKQNGVPGVAIEISPGKPHIVPLAKVIEAPVRSRPTLVWSNPHA
jgi:hypothetical protein